MARRQSAPTNIEVDKTTLGRALKSQRLVVPSFQREYSWKPPRVKKLFSDFQSAMTKGQDSYFLGTIVLQGTTPPGLIDGQQRLATTCIFLAAVRDAFLSLGAKEEADSITNDFLFAYDRKIKENLPRLLMNIDDREYMKNCILSELRDRRPQSDRKEVHSHRLMEHAFTISQDWVKKITAKADTPTRKIEELNVWVDFIESKAVVVALTPASLSQAYQMFITLNDRAQRTTQADLVKSHLFQEVSDGETEGPHITEATAKWATARKMVDVGAGGKDDPLLSYLHHLCVLRSGPITLDKLFEVIEGNISGRTQSLAFLDDLSSHAKPYRAAIGDNSLFWDDRGHGLHRCVDHVIKNMGMRFPIPLLLAIAVKFSERETKSALRAIEAWAVRSMISAAHRSGRVEHHFFTLANRVYKGEITTCEHLAREAEGADGIIAPDSLFVEKFCAKTISSKKQARFVLLELEAQVRADDGDAFAAAVDEPDRLNLEHILPKNKDTAKSYKEFTSDERKACVSKIGNLALLKYEDNGALNDSPFTKKLPVLSKSSIKTTQVVAEFATANEWTPAAIDARQRWLSTIAVKRWPLFSKTVAKKGRA